MAYLHYTTLQYDAIKTLGDSIFFIFNVKLNYIYIF